MSILRLTALTGLTLLWIALIQPTPALQPIYKVEDRDGNVIYTDEKPSPDAEPLDLPELGVMGEDAQPLDEALAEQPAIDPAIEPLTLAIAQPADGAQITATGEGVPVVLNSNLDLPPSVQIVLFIDDQPQDPIRQLAVNLSGLEPGTYRLHAELQTPSGRLLTRTETIAFLLRAPPEPTP